jgi:hypothetical protein
MKKVMIMHLSVDFFMLSSQGMICLVTIFMHSRSGERVD